jgi:hypothetical protein
VTREQAERYATDKHCPYIEVSAMKSINVNEAFNIVVREYRKAKMNSRAAMDLLNNTS